MRYLAMAYSILCYFTAVFCLGAFIFFIGDLIVPVTLNQASPVSPQFTALPAILANLGLILLWSLQHSVMADPRFKAWWTRIVPSAVERSTFILCVAIVTTLLMALWSPLPAILWDVSGTALGALLWVGFALGWTITFVATFLINHFHLFGLEQAYRHLTRTKPRGAAFVTPLLYRIVRHPMMTGILIALWCTPTMTAGRLLFNIAMTAYILIGTRHEEETLLGELGEEYEAYRRTTPMLLPRFKARPISPTPSGAT